MIETNKVLLVNEQDKPMVEMEKLVAQYQDHLHRALSVFILKAHKSIFMSDTTLIEYENK